jgi:vacuolar-type H+-ATPase subunit H
MLALAQKLHDEYVRNGEQQRDRIVGEAREHAQRLMREAEEKQRQTLGSLEQERSLLERKIDELRAFEREYRSRLKSYLEGQLRELEAKAAVVPSRPPQQTAAVGAGAQVPYSGRCPPAAPTAVEQNGGAPSTVRRSALRQFGRPVRYAGRLPSPPQGAGAGCGCLRGFRVRRGPLVVGELRYPARTTRPASGRGGPNA